MNKERLTAFTDAILAIIMTILVLELERPAAATWEALWALRSNFFAYAVSFFMLGAMWVNLHSQWQRIQKIDNRVVWWSIVMLFFVSLCPYATSFVSDHFLSPMAQGFYWVISMLVTLSNTALGWALSAANRDNVAFHDANRTAMRSMWLDIAFKVVILILAILFYPPLVLYGVILSSLIPTFSFHRHHGSTNGSEPPTK